jgi:hypothetical protein
MIIIKNRRSKKEASGPIVLFPALRPRHSMLPSSLFKSNKPPPPRPPTRQPLQFQISAPPHLWRTRHRRIPCPRHPRRAKRWTRLHLPRHPQRRRRRGGCCGCAARCSTTSGAAAVPLPSSRASPATRTPIRRAPTPSSGWARTRRRPRSSSTTGRSLRTGSRGTPTRSAPRSPRGGEATSHSSSRYFIYKLTNGSVLSRLLLVSCRLDL